MHSIAEPVQAELPEFVQAYLDRNGLPFDHGTVVVWVDPDGISYRTPAPMREHLIDNFGVTYLYLLDRAELFIDGKKVEAVDPLFLIKGARYFLDEDKGGAATSTDWKIPVKYALDPESGQMTLTKVEDAAELTADDPNVEAIGTIYVRVSRFPHRLAEFKQGKPGTDTHRRFEVRKTRRGMSFVLGGREIETVDVFPRPLRRPRALGTGRCCGRTPTPGAWRSASSPRSCLESGRRFKSIARLLTSDASVNLTMQDVEGAH